MEKATIANNVYLKCNYTNVSFKGEYLISFKTIEGWHTCLIKEKDLIRKNVGLAKITLLAEEENKALVEIGISNLFGINKDEYKKQRFYVPKEKIVEN